MYLKSIVAALAILALPVCAQAQAQKPAAKVTNADAQKVVKMISADKAKTQTYCDMAKLGPEYVALMDGVQTLDQNSKAGKDIGDTLEGLDKLCAK